MSWQPNEKNKLGKPEQLCWRCKNCICGCSWARDLIPVPGWIAEPDMHRRQDAHDQPTFKIFGCPEFERSKK